MATRPKHAAYLKKAPSKVQSEFAAWIEKVTGHAVPAGDVALVQRLYPLYLKTPEVVKARKAAKQARDEEAAKKAEKVRKQKQERLVALEQQRHRLMQELGLEPEGEVPSLAVVPDIEADMPASHEELARDAEDETTDESTGLVLGAPSDEFVEVTPDEDGEASDGDDDDLWDEPDDGEDDF